MKRLLETGRTGFYLRVIAQGHVTAGDALELARRDPEVLPVAELLRLSVPVA